MEELKKILGSKDVLREGNILKVDNFLNQKVDLKIMNGIVEEFYQYFKDKGIDKIVTIESGGIAPSMLLANKLNIDLLILKKSKTKFAGEVYETSVKSYTKNIEYVLNCAKENIEAGEKILFIDDFLANGQAFLGVQNIVEQAKAEIVGVGIIIEKSFQEGAKIIEDSKVDKYSVVKVKGFENNSIIWG